MINKTDNYIEAKRIIKNSINDEYEKSFMKAQRNRTLLLSGFCAAFAATLGIATGSVLAAVAAIPFSTFGIICSIVPIILHKKNNKNIENGEFFRDKSHKEVIDIANRYADTYNKFEENNYKEKYIDYDSDNEKEEEKVR